MDSAAAARWLLARPSEAAAREAHERLARFEVAVARLRGDLPVRIDTEPPGLATRLSFTSGAALQDVLKGLHAAAPGPWLLFAPGLAAPLQPSCRLVKDVVPPTDGQFVIRAVKRKPKNANRIQALQRLACPSGGGTDAERRRALQKLELELRKL